jgi:hypothetical protein
MIVERIEPHEFCQVRIATGATGARDRPAFSRREREDPIIRLRPTLRESDTLVLIGVEPRIECATPEYGL